MNFIIRLLITAAVAYGLSATGILSGIHIPGYKQALALALVLALLNVAIKPVLIILTLPITIVTLGLFLLVINAIIILLADKFLSGIKVDGFWWALIFSILLSAVSSFLYSLVKPANK
ncbi:MAG: phage holin family protein [Niastella sp.]|nr:phage holin family protein [Niastella sp.]